MMREITESDYSLANYGDGSAPKTPTVIVLDTDGVNLTAGKEYPVVEHRAWVYVIRADNGHEKVFSMKSDTHAHVKHYDNRRPPFARVFSI